METRVHDQGHPILHLQAIAAQARNLARVIGDQPQAMDPQVAEDLGADAVVAQVGSKAKPFIGFHRVQSTILEAVGPQFINQADAPALLAQVHHHPFARLLDHGEGGF